MDDRRAGEIAGRLRGWGEALFDAVFAKRSATRLFNAFQDAEEEGRLLTVAASHPEILALPWELLCDPQGTFLVHEHPRVSIRRKLAGAGGGRRGFKLQSKASLRLLFVVCRPKGAGFIDPRTEPQAVLKAIQQEAPGRVEVEFLRPATFDHLVRRLEAKGLPAVDVVHFDGHGTYDAVGDQFEAARRSDPNVATKQGREEASNIGYLLFEDEAGEKKRISAETLGDMLHRQKVGLMVLSACESAKVAGEDAMGCVAARLTHGGIPAVLAMTHSVLAVTTERLFGEFYGRLGRNESIGEALDNARRSLYLHPERGERHRGQEERIVLRLQDWFLPALYQGGQDRPLLRDDGEENLLSRESGLVVSNFPEVQEAGFWGRAKELWATEQAFVRGTRRLTLSGFGEQGKTFLALEAGRWLLQTGMFEGVCWVDYSQFRGEDALQFAVTTLGTVFGESLLDSQAATGALGQRATLVILDNLEVLGAAALQELLTAAKDWSEAGDCRVLLTSRMPNLGHRDYPVQRSRKHLSLPLAGLGQEDALKYFQALMKLPPEPLFELPQRSVLLELFGMVDFHPLSIGMLAQQLRVRRPAELGMRLEQLVAQTPDNPLLASLNLSLERLDEEAQQFVARLGVFQGGAFELNLLWITQLGAVGDVELIEGANALTWTRLREALEMTGLIQVENVAGVNLPYLKFHPTLAPALWSRLPAQEQETLLARHRERYYQLSSYLCQEDWKNPEVVCAIAKRELPNLLAAVEGALEAKDTQAVDFVNKVCRFLHNFGFNKERAKLSQQAAQLGGDVGSHTWFLSRSTLGEQLYDAGRYGEAVQIFLDVLAGLGEEPSYNRCVTLAQLGPCLQSQGQAAQAVAYYQQGLAVAEQLEASDQVKQLMGTLEAELGDALIAMGDWEAARSAHERSLAIDKEVGDRRGEAVSNMQLGAIALLQDNLAEAAQRYQQALATFQQLNEPATEAVAYHQLGLVFQEDKQWDAAESYYRESARLQESLGNLAGVAGTWNQLAMVNAYAGKPEAAEPWYRKAISGSKQAGDELQTERSLNNLAYLLQDQPERLAEAKQLAEEALAIMQTLDPEAAEIWKTYTILAEIARKQGDSNQREYRRLARETYAASPRAQSDLQQQARIIAGVVAAVEDESARAQLEAEMEQAPPAWDGVFAAIRQILAGERDQDLLCEPLRYGEAMIVGAILEQLGAG